MNILEKSPFTVLSAFGMTCRWGKTITQDVFRNRLLQLLKPYVEGELQEFDREFTRCAAAISGSTALWMLLMPADWEPDNLHILVPSRKGVALIQFFEHHEYTVNRVCLTNIQRKTIR